MQPDTPTDYLALHTCRDCETQLTLRIFPVDEGWLAGTGCECRGRGGLPLRYSTDSPTFSTLTATCQARESLLCMEVSV